MKQLRAVIAILLISLLLVACCACKKTPQESGSFYDAANPTPALTSKISIPIEGCRFVTFLNRGMMEITDEEGTYHGAMDRDGRIVIEPNKYSALSMVGDFFFAEGNLAEGLYVVLNLSGEIVYSAFKPIEISDVGEGCVRILEDGRPYLYDSAGNELIAGTSLDSTYEHSVCKRYVVTRSKTRKNAFVFLRETGNLELALYGSDSVSYEIAYLGGKDFLAIREEAVSSSDDYTYSIKSGETTRYIRQTMQIHTLDGSAPRTVRTEAPFYSLTDRYSFGVSQQSRENYGLKEGYFALRTYRLEGKSADGTTDVCVSDATLRPLARLPEESNPLIRPVKGAAAVTGASGTLYLVDDALNLLKTFDDAVYQSPSFSGSLITVTNITAGSKRGCLDKNGNVVIPFEYSYISEFFGDYAVASKGGKSYAIRIDGTAREIGEETFPYYWLGYYETTANGKIGIASLDGTQLVPTDYDTLEGVGRYGGEVFVALKKDGKVTVYRLF